MSTVMLHISLQILCVINSCIKVNLIL